MRPDPEYLFDNSGNNDGWTRRVPVAVADGEQPPPPGATTCDILPSCEGYNWNVKDDVSSIITLCLGPLQRRADYVPTMTQRVDIAYPPNSMTLKVVVDGSLALLLIHELSHTRAVFGDYYTGRL